MGSVYKEYPSTVFFGAVILLVYVLQIVTLWFLGSSTHDYLFVLESDNVLHVWTWFTSVFAHSPYSLYHILGNGVVLVFFAPVVEELIGSKKFAVLFITSGVIAGLGQILLATGATGVVGASGALLAILGVLTIHEPRMTVYFYFLIPLPLWLLTIGFAGFSVFGVVAGVGNVAHGAHVIGLVIGILYGQVQKDD